MKGGHEEMTVEIQQSLVEDIARTRVSLFLGAGASCEAGLPSSQGLAQHLVERAGSSFAQVLDNQPLDVVSQYLYSQDGYGKQWVRQQIIEYFDKKHQQLKRPPSSAHEVMTSIQWRTIFTTNYDRLIEIAYDSSSNCVQRLLPIYAPDRQILRHEAEVVRLIKLNGSVDEAARNSSHELVLTFAEQQDARSRNSDFYELFQEEAVNGPIVFVGFRFIHPGASGVGTSPEFQQIRDLLREMGPAARWHYCVAPFDSSSPETALAVSMLRANRVAVINATFGDFLSAVTEKLKEPAIPLLDKPPIVVPVSNASITIGADDFVKDQRHFETLGTYVEKLSPPPVVDSLNGSATWASFLEGHFIKRACRADVHKVLTSCIENAPEILLFSAPPGWGKTFLFRDIAVEAYRSGRPVVWLNPYSTVELPGKDAASIALGAWDTVRLDHLLGSIADTVSSQHLSSNETVPIIIADNCPERAPEVLSLFRELTANSRAFVLIFTVRDNEYSYLIDQHMLLKRARKYCPDRLYDPSEEVRTLIDFCTKHKVATIDDPAHRDIVAQSISREDADTELILALQIIFDKKHRPFSEIVQDFWQSLDSEISQKLVMRTAALHRFGSAFSPRLYSLLRTFPAHLRAEVLESYNVCLANGLLFERMEEDEPCVFTLHSLVAQHFVKVCGKDLSEVEDELVTLVRQMTPNVRDTEMIRRLLKQITDYETNLSSEQRAEELFRAAASSTRDDWVVCQQFAKYLLSRNDHELAFAWIERALASNPEHASLYHTKGNIFRRWGMMLQMEGELDQAYEKFRSAGQFFAMSRVRPNPDEYGYVTHLDMIRYQLRRREDRIETANLRAEGIKLYREGLRAVPGDRFNLLLDERFQRDFDWNSSATRALCDRIRTAVDEGTSSVHAAAFLAEHLYEDGQYDEAVQILHKHREASDAGVLVWIKEAEIHARQGKFSEASLYIDSAKRRREQCEDVQIWWSVMYWDLLVAVVLEDFGKARRASAQLAESGFFSQQKFPRGYIWQAHARKIKPSSRSFREHGKIWHGRVDNTRAGGRYGRISMTNLSGEQFFIDFNPRYFPRKEFRRGDHIEFVVTILPNRLRADAVDSRPFVNTVDDLFIP